MSDDDQCLFVVNPGSDTVSSFKIYHDNLELVGEYYTDGTFPISVTHYDRFVYVLNAGDEGSISGYRVNTNNCRLRPMDRSTRSLNIVDGENPPNFLVAPSQISFTPDGKSLIVVIKGVEDGFIYNFPLRNNGRTRNAITTISEGFTPFGFDFDANGNLLLTEAFGLAPEAPAVGGPTPNAGAVSSYSIEPFVRSNGNNSGGDLETITESLGNGQTATCWLKYSGICAFSTSTPANTISTYKILPNGELKLLDGAAFTLDNPSDLSIVDGKFMYVRSTSAEDEEAALYVFKIDTKKCTMDLVEVESIESLASIEDTVFGPPIL